MTAVITPTMTFQEFQNRARLYVIGALYPNELAEFESATQHFGQKARQFIRECYGLREAFALSLRPANSREALKRRVLAKAHSQCV